MKQLVYLCAVLIWHISHVHAIGFYFEDINDLGSWNQLSESQWGIYDGNLQLNKPNDFGEGMIFHELPSFDGDMEIDLTFEYGHNPSRKNNFLIHLMANYGLNYNQIVGLESICFGVNQTNASDTLYLYYKGENSIRELYKTEWSWLQFKDSIIKLKVIVKQNDTMIISINTLNNNINYNQSFSLPILIASPHFGFSVNSTVNYIDKFKVYEIEQTAEFYDKVLIPFIDNTQFLNCSALVLDFSEHLFHQEKPLILSQNKSLNYQILGAKRILIDLPICMQNNEQVTLFISDLYSGQLQPLKIDLAYKSFQEKDLQITELYKTQELACVEILFKDNDTYDDVIFKIVGMLNNDTISSKWEPNRIKVLCNKNETTEFQYELATSLQLAEPIQLKLLNADDQLIDHIDITYDEFELPGTYTYDASLERYSYSGWRYNTTFSRHSLGQINDFGQTNELKNKFEIEDDLFQEGDVNVRFRYQFKELNWLMNYRLFKVGGQHIKTSETNQSLVYSGKTDIDLHFVSKGLYILFVECFNTKGDYFRKKFPLVIH